MDTLGAMVAEVKANGRLRVTSLGGMRAENGETENVRVYTRSGKVYEGTLQLCNASVHVNGEYAKQTAPLTRPRFCWTRTFLPQRKLARLALKPAISSASIRARV